MAILEFENGSSIADGELPSDDEFRRWIEASLPATHKHAQICLRIMDEDEIQHLNHHYRHKNSPTNVLSFRCELPEGVDSPLLGDLAICAQVIKREALEQNKPEPSHWAHMAVHGTLHLLGYDHIEEAQAIEMESLETKILNQLGFPCPYTEQREN